MYEADSRTGRPKQEVPAPGAAPAAAASSEDDKKTKKQLVDELAGLRQRIKDLEAFEIRAQGDRQRAQGHAPAAAIPPRRKSSDHLHHQGLRRLRLHLSSAKICAPSWDMGRRR